MDKVIIDGVDVSGCEFFSATGQCKIQQVFQRNEIVGIIEKPYGVHLECNLCDKNCYYKQLKRLQAEYDDLHLSYAGCKTANTGLQELNQKLEQENERLKEEKQELSIEIVSLTSKLFTLEKSSNDLSQGINKLYQAIQEIRDIAEKPKPFRNFSEIKTATEVRYDYATICNELELRLHKVLELITKAEEENE